MSETSLHPGSNSNVVEDNEADYFAMCLLMPEEFVRREVRSAGGIDIADDKGMAKLAKKFGVSTTAMALRIGQIKWGRR